MKELLEFWLAFWHDHWDALVHYVGTIVPWIVETKLRFLQIFLSWPAVVLYLGATFMLMFRREIAFLLTKIEEFNLFGARMRVTQQPQEPVKEPEPPEPEPEQEDALLNVAERLEECRESVEQYKTAYEALAKRFSFERSLNIIFGSQLDFLRALHATPDGLIMGAAMAFFIGHQRALPSGAAFENISTWAAFLLGSQWVTYDGPTAVFTLTPKGREFVEYVNEQYKFGPQRWG